MEPKKSFSILFPHYDGTEYRQLSTTACHDIGLDTVCGKLSDDPKERNIIMSVLSNMTADRRVAEYRQKVFADILRLPDLRKRMLELFDKIEFIRSFGMKRVDSDEKLGLWQLMHRLNDLDDYISCVEAMRECLSDSAVTSDGLVGFRELIDKLYNDACFAEMKKDIAALKEKTDDIQSVTLGINVNERFEAVSMGLVSVNSKPFKKSGIVRNFADAVAAKDRINNSEEWNGDMHYHLIDKESNSAFQSFIDSSASCAAATSAPFADNRITMAGAPDGDGIANSTFHLEGVINKMLDLLVKRLRDTLTKYADIAVINISQVIPEFVYYIRFAEFIGKLSESGFTFCEPSVLESADGVSMQAKGFYNLKLALNLRSSDEIVPNDLDFSPEHTVYILTGANRGGKTTVTQAIGLLFVLAQGGISVPASEFSYKPVDCIYTHFPADEDKTMDLGRLGEECVRFKEIYNSCTEDSLMLLNESFSTTSFEEGYYIARDSVKALLKKQARTIYNTHMHKLAEDTDEMSDGIGNARACSLVVKSDNSRRSFKLEITPPEGMSYARDIAEKYGVTYEMLTGEK